MSKNQKLLINCSGKIINLKYPVAMGIINLTPDSFYDGGKYKSVKEIIASIHKMVAEGAAIIDIGAVSTRPGSKMVSEEEEWNRLFPVLQILKTDFCKTVFSLDTFRSGIAKKAVLGYGISIINDISAGGFDKNMFKTIAELNTPYIIMHIRGTPQNMQKNLQYNNLMKEIIQYFSHKIESLKSLGVNDVIIDPGFGFGKTIDHNYELLKNLSELKIFKLPILAGLSRKSMIYKLLNYTPGDCLNCTTVLNTIALHNGADILRVHDVKEAVDTIKIMQKFKMQP